jgi:hypothetical protein
MWYLSFHLRQHLTQFFSLSMLSSTAYGRNIIPPHICYSIIVQMIDSIQILTLLMWQNFNTKRGTQQQKTVGMETLNTHFFINGIYFVQKN